MIKVIYLILFINLIAAELFTASGSEERPGRGGHLGRFKAAWNLLSMEPSPETLNLLLSFHGTAEVTADDDVRELILTSLESHKENKATLALINQFFEGRPDFDCPEFAVYFERSVYKKSPKVSSSAKGSPKKKDQRSKAKIAADKQISIGKGFNHLF